MLQHGDAPSTLEGEQGVQGETAQEEEIARQQLEVDADKHHVAKMKLALNREACNALRRLLKMEDEDDDIIMNAAIASMGVILFFPTVKLWF